MKRNRVAVFGCTGSIGRSALEVIKHLEDELQLVAIAAHHSVDQICLQAHRYQPETIILTDPAAAQKARSRLGGKYQILAGTDALNSVAASPKVDTIVMAITGTAGLNATLAALSKGKKVALATKEILVSYGEIVIRTARRFRATILPVDSELAALHQCLNGRDIKSVRRLILTASGGPFWQAGPPQDATIDNVLNHPTWKMGKKITVDSATLMNKGLEVIETVKLLGVPPDKVATVIHPESIVHSLIEFIDGSIIAQLSRPDMRLPIQYCLTYPRRLPSLVAPLELTKVKSLNFFPPNSHRFPCLKLAYQAVTYGATAPCVLNAANQVAVEAFLNRKIAFGLIPAIIKDTLNKHMKQKRRSGLTLSLLREAEQWATDYAFNLIKRISGE